MNTQTLSPSNLRKKGLQALHKSLGPVGMVRFLQQFEEGTGDYTRDRKQWLTGKSVPERYTSFRSGNARSGRNPAPSASIAPRV